MTERVVIPRAKKPPEWRFWPKVDVREPDECWTWLAGKSGDGYGAFWLDGRQVKPHRYAYELLVGPIPEDRPHLDHLCRNRACVNPVHLEPVTSLENTLRGVGLSAKNQRKRFCKWGHRTCLACHRKSDREAKRAKYHAQKRIAS